GDLKPQKWFRIMKRNKQIMVERIRTERPVVEAPAAPASIERNQQSPPQNNSLSGTMAAAYVAAVDALLIARDYAEHKGIPFRISPAELRACAHSIFIQSGRLEERKSLPRPRQTFRFVPSNRPLRFPTTSSVYSSRSRASKILNYGLRQRRNWMHFLFWKYAR